MLYPLRTISLSACLIAAVLGLSCQQAAAGIGIFPAVGSNAANARSWLAGAHAGYNWQRGSVVFGFETDLQGTHLNSSMNGGLTRLPPIIPLGPLDFANTKASIDYTGPPVAASALPPGSGCFSAPRVPPTAMSI